MRTVIYAFTGRGRELAQHLQAEILNRDWDIALRCEKGALSSVGEDFAHKDLLVFIGAVGIAVRTVAPCLKGKLADPAVLVIDECGRYVIPILSGHFGGANEAAGVLAKLLGAEAVITTATDLHGLFAVDVFARKNCLYPREKDLIKMVSAALLRGEPVGLCSELPIDGRVPEGIQYNPQTCRKVEDHNFSEYKIDDGQELVCRIGIWIGSGMESPFLQTLHLIPRNLALGMGCRKGKSVEEIRQVLDQVSKEKGLQKEEFSCLASVDLKKEEPGLLALADQLHIPFVTYPPDRLWQAEGDFTGSEFVASVAGVDNVCERSAACAAGEGYDWIQRKIAKNGVTLAIARRNACISF